MPVYRYKLTGLNLDALKAVLPVGISIVSGNIASIVVWDVTADAAAKADLDYALEQHGWEFVTTDPVDTPVEQAAAENLHAPEHVKDGDDEIDGDKLDIDFTPSNYAPDDSPAEVDDLDHLSAHLKGIDTALAGSGPTLQEDLTDNNSDYIVVGDKTVDKVVEVAYSFQMPISGRQRNGTLTLSHDGTSATLDENYFYEPGDEILSVTFGATISGDELRITIVTSGVGENPKLVYRKVTLGVAA